MKLSTYLLPLLMFSALLQRPAQAEELLAGNSPFLAALSGQQSDASSGPAYTQHLSAPASSLLESIEWWGFHGAASGGEGYDSFSVMLDGVKQAGGLTTSSDANGLSHYYFALHIGRPLNASTLSIINDSPDVEWYWLSTVATGNPNAADGTQVAYTLWGQPVVPSVDEPSMPMLLAGGLLLLALVRQRRNAGGK